jgi:hypothetical protein
VLRRPVELAANNGLMHRSDKCFYSITSSAVIFFEARAGSLVNRVLHQLVIED